MTIHIGRREFISALWSGVVMWSLAARAQQPHRIRRLGVLMGCLESDSSFQCKRQPNSNLSSISRQPRRSTSTCRCTSTNSPTSYAPALGPTPLGVASARQIGPFEVERFSVKQINPNNR
jgi:hypothetical protein